MDLGIKEKIIVVTGGANGIGAGIVAVLAAEGAIPVILDNDGDQMNKVVEQYAQKGMRAGGVKVDLTSPNQCETAVEKILSEFGSIHGLVNNAGINDGVGLEDGTQEAFLESLNRNLVHYYTMAQLLLPELKKNKGSIVNIGSKIATTGQGGTSAYAAANGGRNALTREWAVDLSPFSIRVNCVIIAECYTPLYEKWINSFDNSKEKLAEINKKIPLEQRMTTEEEIANTVAFLISERSSHTTGQLIFVDGGYSHLDRAL